MYFVSMRQNLPVTKITEQLMECRSGNDNDDYIYLDPKLLKRGDTLPKTRAPFQDAIVFVVGGGNYIEYQNLVDFIKVNYLLIIRIIVKPNIFIIHFSFSGFLCFYFYSKSRLQTQTNGLFMVHQHSLTRNNFCDRSLCWGKKSRTFNMHFI